MGNEKEEIQRKINSARERLVVIDAELVRLRDAIAPLKKQLADAEQVEQYLRARIEKLTKILAGL